jgi:hypothetical protein
MHSEMTKFRRLVAAARDTWNRYFIIRHPDGDDEFLVEHPRGRTPVFTGTFDETLKWLQAQRQGSGV